VQRPVFVYQANHSIDQGLPLKITDLPKYGITSEVIRTIGITAGAGERAFLGNFN
jgi:hypothetical protein